MMPTMRWESKVQRNYLEEVLIQFSTKAYEEGTWIAQYKVKEMK